MGLLYLFVLGIPVVLIMLIFPIAKMIVFEKGTFSKKYGDPYARIFLVSTRVLDMFHLIIWTLCFAKAIEPYHDPALVNFMYYFFFSIISLILRGAVSLIEQKYSAKVRYSIDLIVNIVTIAKLSEYAYNALVNL
jgi:hypothetical protein